MAGEGGENGGGGGNHPIFAEEDELQVGFAFVETGKDGTGRDGGPSSPSSKEEERLGWLQSALT